MAHNHLSSQYPAGNYMFKVNNRNTRTRCEICSKLTMKILLNFISRRSMHDKFPCLRFPLFTLNIEIYSVQENTEQKKF